MTQIVVTVENNVPREMIARVGRMERAVKTAVAGATMQLKTAWRQDVASKLGGRLGNAVRAEVYPAGDSSLNAAGLVYAKAPKLIGAHERGAVIRAASGLWLAVPLPAAGKSGRRGRITPDEWERRTGRRLRFVYRAGRNGLLVDDGTARRGAATVGRGFKVARGFKNRTIPIFALVRQVKLPKRLNLKAAALAIGNGLPGRVRAAIGVAI